jgi:hypothetical protein
MQSKYMKAIKLLQTTAVLTMAFIASGTFSSSAQQLINVQFGDPNTTNYSGPAITGSPGDYWNEVTNVSGGQGGDFIVSLNDTANSSTAVSIDISPGYDTWATYPYNAGSYSDLMQSMVQFWVNNKTVTFSGLDDTKHYDLYVIDSPYHQDKLMAVCNGVTNTAVPNTQFGAGSTWVQGTNYLVFMATPTDGSGNIAVQFIWNGVAYTRMCGMQLYAEPPSVTFLTQPQSMTNAPGSTVVLSATATGGNGTPTYQWQKMAGGTYVNMSGQTNNTLTITNLQPSDATNYDVIATAVSQATSNPAKITILTNPNTSISLNPGITILNGTAGFHYQVQYVTNLSQTNWLLLQDIPSLPTNPYTVYDPTPATQVTRFYQAVVLP